MRERSSNGATSKEVAKTTSLGLVPFKPGDAVPEGMRAASSGLFGNTASSEHRTIPMLRLMQGLTPSVQAGQAMAGEIRHNLTNEVVVSPPKGEKPGTTAKVVLLASYAQCILYGPRDASGRREILAQSSDGEEWDPGYANIRTKPVNYGGREITYETGPNPRASGLMDWGSQNPFDKQNRAPALGFTYRLYLRLVELHEIPVLMILEKTATASAKELLTAIDYRTAGGEGPAPLMQVWDLSTYLKQGSGNSWWMPKFTALDLAPSPGLFAQMQSQARQIDVLQRAGKIRGHREEDEMTGGAAGGTTY